MRTRRRARWAALAAAVSLTAGGAVALASTATAAPGCSVTYKIVNSWQGGYQGDVTVTNVGDAVSSWTLGWSFASGQSVTQAWNATVSQSGSQVTATNVAWNGALGTGASATFGFIGSGSATPEPTAFTVNGVACTGSVTNPPVSPSPTISPSPSVSPTPSDPPPPPVTNSDFYVDTNTQAYAAWQKASGSEKDLLAKLALNPASYWVGNWADNAHAKAEVVDYLGRAKAAGKTGILTIYAIPGRDCGNYSSGGVATSEYAAWIDNVASGIASPRRAAASTSTPATRAG